MRAFLSDLFDRRVPQWTAVYLGVAWGLVQFIAFIEERYLISPHWTDLCLLTLGLLLPSVVLFTYNHGRPGADQLKRSDKVGIPANVVIAAIVLWLVFGGKDLGAVTTEVTVTDADGDTIERELPNAAYRRRIALFQPDVTPRSDTAWAGDAIVLGLMMDLAQDSWIDLRYGPFFAERLRKAGFEPGQPVPLALKRQIARDMNLTHFVSGTVQRAPTGYATTLRLHDVARGRLLGEYTYAGPDLLALVDSATVALRHDLEFPPAHLDEVEDLPVAERMSSNPEALRSYARGAAALLRNDWPAAVTTISRAVALDSTFAIAAVDLFSARLYTGDQPGAIAALGVAANHIYRLPERMQYIVRAAQLEMQQETERAIGVYETAARLYPDDVNPRRALSVIYPVINRQRDAIRVLNQILRIDPAQVEHLLTIGGLYRSLGNDDSALIVYERYVQAVPDRPEGPRAIAELHAARGEHADARAQLERAVELDPQDVDVLVALAKVAQDVGDFDEARARLQAAEGAARTPQSRSTVMEARADLHSSLGQPAAAYEQLGLTLQQAALYLPPLYTLFLQLRSLEPLAESGRFGEAERQLDALGPQLPGIFADVVAIGAIALEKGRPEPDAIRLGHAADRLERLIQAQRWEILRPLLLEARALEAERSGDYDTALGHYRAALAADPSQTDIHTDLGRVLRLKGDLGAATRELQTALRLRPSNAKARFELALVHERAGRTEEAVAELRGALDVWQSAESSYTPAARARDALDRLLGARPAAD